MSGELRHGVVLRDGAGKPVVYTAPDVAFLASACASYVAFCGTRVIAGRVAPGRTDEVTCEDCRAYLVQRAVDTLARGAGR